MSQTFETVGRKFETSQSFLEMSQTFETVVNHSQVVEWMADRSRGHLHLRVGGRGVYVLRRSTSVCLGRLGMASTVEGTAGQSQPDKSTIKVVSNVLWDSLKPGLRRRVSNNFKTISKQLWDCEAQGGPLKLLRLPNICLRLQSALRLRLWDVSTLRHLKRFWAFWEFFHY